MHSEIFVTISDVDKLAKKLDQLFKCPDIDCAAIANEAYLRTFTRCNKPGDEIRNKAAYAYRVGQNLAIESLDQITKRKIKSDNSGEETSFNEPGYLVVEWQSLIESCLTEDQAAAVLYRQERKQTFSEIAIILDKSYAQARKLYLEGIKVLRDRLSST